MTQRTLRILAVGMLPPPFTGQGFMFRRAIDHLSRRHAVHVIDTQFQRNLGDAGLFAFYKIARLAAILLLHIPRALLGRRYDVLYFCPSGPSRFGTLKDIIFLALLRWKARKTAYHFFGAGGVAYLNDGPALFRFLAEQFMYAPDLTIRCADVTPNDAVLCRSRHDVIVFNASEDPAVAANAAGIPPWRRDGEIRFSFIGVITRDKGVFDLVEIARLQRDAGRNFTMSLIGEGTQVETTELRALIAAYGLQSHVILTGAIGDPAVKYRILRESTLFLFPTFFRAEMQPVAVIEALGLGVPVVGYDWRGLYTLIEDRVNGRLVPVHDTKGFSGAIDALLGDERLSEIGQAARRTYLERFTLETFEAGVEDALCALL